MKKQNILFLIVLAVFAFIPAFVGSESISGQSIYIRRSGTPTPTPTPGGPVEYFAAVLQEGSAVSHDLDPWSPAAFNPTAGRRLVALVHGSRDAGAADIGACLEISDTQSMTWTAAGNVSNGDGGLGLKAFVSTPVPASVSTTVTVDCGAGSVARYRVAIFEVTGTDGTTAGLITNGAAATDGADSLTLTATPTADDLAVYMRVRAAQGGFIIGGSYAEVVDTDLTNMGVGIAVNDNTTSTTVSITDARDGGGSGSDNIHLAFIIKAG